MRNLWWMGIFGGALICSWLGPKGIAWYFDPPVNIGVNCREATEWAMTRLLRLQLVGAALGLVVAGILSYLIYKLRKPEDLKHAEVK